MAFSDHVQSWLVRCNFFEKSVDDKTVVKTKRERRESLHNLLIFNLSWEYYFRVCEINLKKSRANVRL